MPTFDFKCLQCDHIFEFSRAFGNKTKPTCPECKAKKTEKLMSPPMVVFKGEGFYKTDSVKKAAPPVHRLPDTKVPFGAGQAGSSESEGGKKDETSKSEASQKAKNTDAAKT